MTDHFTTYGVPRDSKVRYGACGDGGYVTVRLPVKYDCYISAGVSNEESFTRDFLSQEASYLPTEQRFAYDGTIQDYPWEFCKDITFRKQNIGSTPESNLSEHISKHKNIFLKMDIEGGEFPWLASMSTEDLSHFAQIVMEFHGVMDDSWGMPLPAKVRCFQKLAETHYIVHAHGNNHAEVRDGIPSVLELTFVRKSEFKDPLPKNTETFPIYGLDFPNGAGRWDMPINFPPFCFPTGS